MSVTINGTTGITTPDVTTDDLTVDTNTLYVDATNNRVGIGTSSPDVLLQVSGNSGAQIKATNTTGGGAYMLFQNADSGSTNNDGLYVGLGAGEQGYMWNYENNVLLFGTNNTERMRVNGNGRVYIGTTSNIETADCSLDVKMTAASGTVIATERTLTTTARHIAFYNPNGQVGSIHTSGTSTAYNTSSDYRLKENNVNITDGIDRVKLLKPYRFNFIADADTTVDGFFAHEVQSVVPEAISGTHNEVDDEGNPVYQGIDQSKLVPLLTAALQEAITKIEALEARVATLEGN